MFLLIFEFIGTQEFVLVLVAALILFGPRKLPELARSVGKSLSEFKRASEEFKGQWEQEVERETAGLRAEPKPTSAPPVWETPPEAELVPVIAANTHDEQPAAALSLDETPAAPASKRDWL